MIPAHFLGGPAQSSNAPTVVPPGGVTITVQRGAPVLDVPLPPSPTALGLVTETITKSTFTETTVTRVTDNHLEAPLLSEVLIFNLVSHSIFNWNYQHKSLFLLYIYSNLHVHMNLYGLIDYTRLVVINCRVPIEIKYNLQCQ